MAGIIFKNLYNNQFQIIFFIGKKLFKITYTLLIIFQILTAILYKCYTNFERPKRI